MTKSLTVQNIGVGLLVILAAAALLYWPKPLAVARTAPVFYGEEVTVRTTAAPVVLINAQPIAAATVPAPVSPVAPLPIVPPSVTVKVLPQYPASALEQGGQGTVLLSVNIGLTGQAEQVETKQSSGLAELDRAAVKAVSQWTFSPATQGGTALASWFEVPVRFELK
ncbi:MAG: energy transducer TonB [Candidatus Margulisbacteria bacterium]|jgi:protein TonB|nr:energy transducer TonB [Candidatus Margulisiibacteriota bacterium]